MGKDWTRTELLCGCGAVDCRESPIWVHTGPDGEVILLCQKHSDELEESDTLKEWEEVT
jgi:hypothetical protein